LVLPLHFQSLNLPVWEHRRPQLVNSATTTMATENHTEIKNLEAEAEAGPGAMSQDTDQTVSATDTAKEKEMNNTGATSSECSVTMGPQTEEAPKAGPPQQGVKQRSKARIALIMAALMMAVFLAALDMTIITTALPTIAANFQVSNADYTWIGSAYLLGAASSTPSWGKFSDIFGRKPIMLVANIVFLIGSLICALSINIKMLLAGRVIQGIGGGGLIILANICVSDLFSMRYCQQSSK
jgi:fucose permease